MWRPGRGSFCWLVTLNKSVQSLSYPEDYSVKGPHNWMLTDWLDTRISAFLGCWQSLSNTEGLRKSIFTWHSIFGISYTPLLNGKWEFQCKFFQWNTCSLSLFLSLCRLFYFLSLHATDFSAVIHHKRDTGALYNFSFCHHNIRLAPGF